MKDKIEYLKSVLANYDNYEELDTTVAWLRSHMKDLVDVVDELIKYVDSRKEC